MKFFFLKLFTLAWLASQAHAVETPVPQSPSCKIDLTQNCTVEDLLESGVPLKKISENVYETLYLLENCASDFKFPNGVQFIFYAELFTLSVKDGKIHAGEGNGLVMPLEQAYNLVLKAHEASGIQTTRLEDWISGVRGNPNGVNGVPSFMNGGKSQDGKFSFTIGIHSSINALYPVFIQLSFGFEGESVADKNLKFKRIPLNPDKLYLREDAYRHLHNEQPRQALNAGGERSSPVKCDAVLPSTVSVPRASSVPIGWWWLGILALIVLAFTAYILRKRHR